jgi:hypothetical protein
VNLYPILDSCYGVSRKLVIAAIWSKGNCLCRWHIQRGPKVTSVLRAPRAAGVRNICVGFADVTHASGVNPAWIWCICHQVLRTNFAWDVRHIQRESGAYVTKCYAQISREMCVISSVNLVHMSPSATHKFRVRCAPCSPPTSCKYFAHLLREEHATRDVTFAPLCSCEQKLMKGRDVLRAVMGKSILFFGSCTLDPNTMFKALHLPLKSIKILFFCKCIQIQIQSKTQLTASEA